MFCLHTSYSNTDNIFVYLLSFLKFSFFHGLFFATRSWISFLPPSNLLFLFSLRPSSPFFPSISPPLSSFPFSPFSLLLPSSTTPPSLAPFSSSRLFFCLSASSERRFASSTSFRSVTMSATRAATPDLACPKFSWISFSFDTCASAVTFRAVSNAFEMAVMLRSGIVVVGEVVRGEEEEEKEEGDGVVRRDVMPGVTFTDAEGVGEATRGEEEESGSRDLAGLTWL
mmetsp:Transcript_20784/g.37192  ORF Transcript_20784/g.37192 Transcript_20784/m.37192 type:complete len:227 (-) Transcript_20784:309-989(-)